MDRTIRKGAKKPVGFEMTARDGGIVTITNATFLARDIGGNIMQASNNANITNNETAKVYVSGVIDTTAAAFAIGTTFEVLFSITTNDGVVGIESLLFEVGEA